MERRFQGTVWRTYSFKGKKKIAKYLAGIPEKAENLQDYFSIFNLFC